MANISFVRVYEEYNDVFIEVCYEKEYRLTLKTFVGMENVPKTVVEFMKEADKKYQYDGSAMAQERKTHYYEQNIYNEILYKQKETNTQSGGRMINNVKNTNNTKKGFKEMSNVELIQAFAWLYSMPVDNNGKTRKGHIKKADWIIEEFVKRGIIEDSDVENITSFFVN